MDFNSFYEQSPWGVEWHCFVFFLLRFFFLELLQNFLDVVGAVE
jgi:hypothetical protein